MKSKLVRHFPRSLKSTYEVNDHFRQEMFCLKSILRKMPGSVYWKDKNGVYLGCNDFVLTMAGTNYLNDVVGKTDFDLPWKKYATEIRRVDQQVMETGSLLEIEEHPILADGRQIIMLTRKVPLLDEKGNIMGVLGISVDITDRKKLEISLVEAKEKAEEANRAKIEFLENMRHDIRTPLAGITGFARMIEDETFDPHMKEHAHNLVASGYALSDLLNEILEAVKLNSGFLPVSKNKFDLHKRLEDIIQLNQANAQHKNIKLYFEYDPAIPSYLLGDNRRVHRLVLELINNAINFTDKGSVTLKAMLAKTNGQDLIIKIIVEDTGIGIDPKNHESIFSQFKRLTPSYEGRYKGAGLGLSVVKQFIEELQGEIYVDSQIGIGTKFICILPFKKPLLEEEVGVDDTSFIVEQPVIPEKSYTAYKMKDYDKKIATGHSILLVEDHSLAAKVALAILETLNYDVDVAANGKHAVQLTQEKNYDLIFMDIGLPEMDGYETAQQIRLSELNKGRCAPIIALTAHGEEEHTQRCIQAGMNAVLTKPLTPEKAGRILNTFISCQQPLPFKQAEENILSLAIIDFKIIKNTTGGNEELAHEMLQMFFLSLPEEMEKLHSSYEKEDWKSIKTIVHKLNGGTSYCGALRLHKACVELETAIGYNKIDQFSLLYRQLINEIEAVRGVINRKSYFN